MDRRFSIILARGDYMDCGPAEAGLITILEYTMFRDGVGGWVSLLDILENFVYHKCSIPRNLNLPRPLLLGALDYYDFLRTKTHND